MDERHIRAWAKDKHNQKLVVDTLFSSYKPQRNKVAIFMAGIPGAGKTEFATNTLMAIPGFMPIEHDALVEYIHGYEPANYYSFRSAGSTLVTKVFENCLKEGYDFIFDGTLTSDQSHHNIQKTLAKGYKVNIMYILQDRTAAWELTQARELVKKRSIEPDGFVKSCQKIHANLLQIFSAHKTDPHFSFWVIDKRFITTDPDAKLILHNEKADHSKEIEELLSNEYGTM